MKILVALLLSLYGVITANAVCADVIVDSASYECNNPGVFNSTSLNNMPDNSKVILITGEVKIKSFCTSSTRFQFAALTIEPEGTAVNIVNLTYSAVSNTVIFRTQSGNDLYTAYSLKNGFDPINQWISFNVYLALDSNVASGYFALPGTSTPDLSNYVTFPTTYTFNANPKLYLCSGPVGTNSFECDFANVRVIYSLPGNTYDEANSGLLANKIASYVMTQTSGYAITDSVSLGRAYLGSSTAEIADLDPTHMPSWEPAIDPTTNKPNQNRGLKFTANTQYVSVPYFPIAQDLKIVSYSFGFRVWLKLPSSLTEDGYIFTYSTSDLATQIFGVKLVSTKTLLVSTYDAHVRGSISLSLGQWNSIIVDMEIADYKYDSAANSATHFLTIRVNNVIDYAGDVFPVTRYTPDATDVVRLGGPPTVLGTMAGFEIYSPASTFMTSSGCSASTCQLDIGANTLSNSVCALPICPAYCSACQDNQASGCLGCAAGYVFFQDQCILSTALTCPTGKYLDNSYVCQNCPSNCDFCSDSSTCTTCSSNYLLYNHQCVDSCPLTSYPTGATCQNCPSHCNVCSDSSTCTSCSSTYLPYDGQCYASCPAKTYSTGTACVDCPMSNCDQCTSSTCNTCSATYLLYNNECVTSCPATTYSTGTACQNCPTYCDTCSDSSTCTACSRTYLLYNHQCYTSCPVKTYSTGSDCVDCSIPNCDQCTSSTCSTCSTNYLLYNNECLSSCPAGMYWTGSTCQTCNNLIYKNQCITSCPAKTYSTGTACVDCSNHCSECTSEGCSTCDDGYTLNESKLCALPETAESSLSAGAIVGIVIGSIAGVSLVGGLTIAYVKRKVLLKFFSRQRALTHNAPKEVASSPRDEKLNLTP